MKLILLGAPGAGKGTQAEIISEKLHIPTISTGNILREAIKNGTETGMKAKSFMDAGKLVPDDVIIGIVSERVAQPDCENGFILDGVPRTIPQAEALEAAGIHFDRVISIEIEDPVIEARMTGRRVCGSCGASFHITAHPPKVDGVCDVCGKELVIRKDDAPETVKNRLKVFHAETEPLKDFYAKLGVLKLVEGDQHQGHPGGAGCVSMISVKNEREIEVMRRACKITAAARALAGEMVRPGVTTKQIDKAVHDYIVSQGAKPTFLGYGGFPASVCISVNEVVIHGIPGHRVLKEGDIVSIDVGAQWGGFTGDCAATFACGKISAQAQKLITVTEQSFYEGIKFARQGCRISDIGHAVQTYVESHGFGVVRAFVGHGVGEHLHEEPEIPNFGAPGRGPRMVKGMTLAVEPMVTEGTYEVRVLKDKWTTVTADGLLAAHYENSILITDGEPEILTVTEGL